MSDSPQTPEEGILARIWGEVLGHGGARVASDFFALGGTSVSAAQMFARVLAETGVALTYQDLFEGPRLGDLAAKIAARRSPSEVITYPPIGRASPADAYPLTSAQRRMWFLEQLHPDRPTYRMVTAIHFRGALRVEALGLALGDLVARHGALRTTFHERDGVPMQCPQPPGAVPLPVVDLPGVAPGSRESVTQRMAWEEARLPLDLRTGPVVRASLLRFAEDDHVLLLLVHHLVFDARSRVIALHDLGQFYRAAAMGAPPELGPVAVDYVDFATWQASARQEERQDRDLAYWLAQLGPEPPVLEVLPDHPRPVAPDFESARVPVTLATGMHQRLRDTAAREGVTVASILLSAFTVLLYRHTASESMVVGLLVAGRRRAESRDLVGLFVNELALRLDVSPEDTFRTLLPRIARTIRAGLDHQDEPLDELLRAVRTARQMGSSPLFHVAFNYKPPRDRSLVFGDGVTATEVPLDRGASPFDLTFEADVAGDDLSCHLDYARELFEPERMRRMGGHFRTLLDGLMEEPDRPIDDLRLLGSDEWSELLGWNDTRRDYPRERLIHELVEDQVDRAPDAVAVAFGRDRLSYGELDRRANQLARHLTSMGAGPGVGVGICLERSTEMVVAMLAIHKAGAAYVPLDPGFPAERLAFMVADSAISIVVTERSLRSVLPPHRATLVLMDGDAGAIARQQSARPQPAARSDCLAYILYTSGSTGRPKGVRVPVAAVVNFLWSVRADPGLSANDRVIALTTLSFDIAVLELWLPLVCGARIVLASRDVAADGGQLRRLVEDEGVTLMQATPTTWRLLLAAGWQGSTGFRALCGGEAFPPDLAEQLTARATVWNMYGPTETTVWSTLYRVPRPVGAVLIGRPLANTQAHVLDRRGRHVPVGVPGELHIGGDGVAAGYLNRPELSAERFLPDPFRDEPGGRLYRTGDTVRLRSSGDLEYLGRGDHQVKLRGFRIELGEIESALAGVRGVGQAVVLLREDRPGDPRLVAYVACDREATPDDGEIRAHLRRTLPEYMVPAAFVRLQRMPLTPNNKIDRRALPAPDVSGVDVPTTRSGERPSTPFGRRLYEIWGELLARRDITPSDDFFDIGGHSLLAVRLMAEIEKVFGIRLPLATLIRAPTLDRLAAVLEEGNPPPPSRVVALQEIGPLPPVFLVTPFRGDALMFRDLGRSIGHDRPLYALQPPSLTGPYSGATIETAASEMVGWIEGIQPRGPYNLAGYCIGGQIAFEVACQLQARGKEVAFLGLVDSVRHGAPGTWRHFVVPAGVAPGPLDRIAGIAFRLTDGRRVASRIRRDSWRAFLKATLRVCRITGLRQPSYLRSDEELEVLIAELHRPRRFAGSLVLFRREERTSTDRRPDVWGWAGLASRGILTVEVPGDHISMLHPPDVKVLGERLAAAIEDANQASRPPRRAELVEA